MLWPPEVRRGAENYNLGSTCKHGRHTSLSNERIGLEIDAQEVNEDDYGPMRGHSIDFGRNKELDVITMQKGGEHHVVVEAVAQPWGAWKPILLSPYEPSRGSCNCKLRDNLRYWPSSLV